MKREQLKDGQLYVLGTYVRNRRSNKRAVKDWTKESTWLKGMLVMARRDIVHVSVGEVETTREEWCFTQGGAFVIKDYDNRFGEILEVLQETDPSDFTVWKTRVQWLTPHISPWDILRKLHRIVSLQRIVDDLAADFERDQRKRSD